MTKSERENWLCNIRSLAATLEQEAGWKPVRFILETFGGGASCIETLHPGYYEAVYHELFDRVAGLKD